MTDNYEERERMQKQIAALRAEEFSMKMEINLL